MRRTRRSCASSKDNFPWINSLILVVFISSCNVAKEYQQPELELPKQFNNVSYADTSSIADIQWRKFFKDTTLQGLIEEDLPTTMIF